MCTIIAKGNILISWHAGGLQDNEVQGIVWHASDRRPAPIVANSSIERLGIAQWDVSALPFAAMVNSSGVLN